MNEFPISRAKVTPPPVREETLARERLLGWLDTAVRRRVVYVIAEAGYGKTTLLADFSHRTRVRCLWFKLDESDRDWLTFLHYLIAAGRESLPDFARATSALLSETASGTSMKDAAMQSFAAELEQLSDRPTAFIFDDYHLVDGDPDVARIVQRMIRALPERMCLIFLSRRRPNLRVARLQSLDEVREIGREDLRFSRDETDRLFSEAYKQPLETDVLDEVEARTEGWAASLQLLRSGLRGRNPAEVRAFVRRMAGSEGSLYDYLAEEVVGELPGPTRRFLVRTSMLDRVTPELALAALSSESEPGPTLHEVRALIQQSETIGLLSRRGESSRWSHRYHPLIREYLLGRLAEELTPEEIREVHRSIARAAEATSWATAAHHWLEADEPSEVVATVERQISSIASSGQYSLAADFLTRAGVAAPGEISEIVQARIDLYAGRVRRAQAYLGSVLRSPRPVTREGLQVLLSIATGLGDQDAASGLAQRLAELDGVPEWQLHIARATLSMRDAALLGPLDAAIGVLEGAAVLHERERRWHLAAISRFNLADLRFLAGAYAEAAADIAKSIDYLQRSGGDATELAPAFGLLALSLQALDRRSEAGSALEEATRRVRGGLYSFEVSMQRAEYMADNGSLADAMHEAEEAIRRMGPEATSTALATICTVGAAVATKAYKFSTAQDWLDRFDTDNPTTVMAAIAHKQLSKARLSLMTGLTTAAVEACDALALARGQGAWHLASRAALIAAASSEDPVRLEGAVSEASRACPSALRSEAAVLCGYLHALAPLPQALEDSISAHPDVWIPHLRHRLEDPDRNVRLACASLLDRFGSWEDVPRLRRLARDPSTGKNRRALGRILARRTAPRVFVDDLGRTTLKIGPRAIEATAIRRKVAALVVYLMTRPGYMATREQVLEALWPDSPPQVGNNSLHQTIYFLRRELEPGYAEDLSAGYVRLEGELVWFDPDLVSSASRRFTELLSSAQAPNLAGAEEAVTLYRGRFAPEFEYEDWAIATRDALHAAYLELVERRLRVHLANGDWAQGAELARAALSVDPSAEGIERNLIALYHHAGSHAAAAEQYAHFAASQRDEYGTEPPSIEVVVTAPHQP